MSKVVNMFEKKKELEEKGEPDPSKVIKGDGSPPSYDFEAEMKANKEKAEKLKQEKAKANKGVIRSYRLK